MLVSSTDQKGDTVKYEYNNNGEFNSVTDNNDEYLNNDDSIEFYETDIR